MSRDPIAIVGAGPYGLSIAAHLAARNVEFRIFGSPMETWRTAMPKGMHLKSEGFASNIYEPNGTFTLKDFCLESKLEYADIGRPVPLETFCAYGTAFARRFVPALEDRRLVCVEHGASGFLLRFEDGGVARARSVVVATGIGAFAHMPAAFGELPEGYASHSSRNSELGHFRGRRVTVIGAGASAVDSAALLHENGAETHLVARTPALKFYDPTPKERPLWRRARAPWSGLGPGWKSRLCCELPDAFYRLPEAVRFKIVRSHLGPAPCYFTKEQVVGKVAMHLSTHVKKAAVRNGRVHLELAGVANETTALVTDHVIAATGFRVDLQRLTFIAPELAQRIRVAGTAPVVSSNFESSVPALYFAGASVAHHFGPLLRFAFGARFTAQRLGRHLSAA